MIIQCITSTPTISTRFMLFAGCKVYRGSFRVRRPGRCFANLGTAAEIRWHRVYHKSTRTERGSFRVKRN